MANTTSPPQLSIEAPQNHSSVAIVLLSAPSVVIGLQSAHSSVVIGFESAVMVILSVAALVGSLLVITTLHRTPRLHTIASLYVLALATADVLMSVLGIPLMCAVLLSSRWMFGPLLCQVQGFVFGVLPWIIALTITLAAINRYCLVKSGQSYYTPFAANIAWYRTCIGVNNTVINITVGWILVLFSSLLPIACGVARFDFHPARLSCFMEFNSKSANVAFSSVHLIFFAVVPMLVIIRCCAKVFRVVRRRSALVMPAPIHADNTTELAIDEIKSTRVCLGIALGFLICWIPVVFIDIARAFLSPLSLPGWVYLLRTYLLCASSAARPIIFAAINRRFRSEDLRVLPAGASVSRWRRRSLTEEHDV